MKFFIRTVLAGMFIGIGAAAFLLTSNPFVFTIGIFLVLNFTGGLITGYMPMSAYNNTLKLKEMLIIICGNAIGAYLFAIALSFTRINVKVLPIAQKIVDTKMSDNYLSIFVMGIFCAVLIGYAVIGASRQIDYLGKMFALLFPTYIFVVLGFEHVVANMFYVTIALGGNITAALPFVLVSLIGNLVGGYLVGYFHRHII